MESDWEKVGRKVLENWEKGFSKGWAGCQDPYLKEIRISRIGQGEVGDWEERRHARRVQLHMVGATLGTTES